jgi:hypothetical protein
MDTFFPVVLLAYLQPFSQAFTSPSFDTFRGYVWAMMVVNGSKCMTKIAHSCFFLGKHISSFERFLSENHWNLYEVMQLLFRQIIDKLADRALVYGCYLLALDTTLVSKTSKRMLGVQKWHCSSSNPDSFTIGHHWAIAGLLTSIQSRWLFWPLLMKLVSGQKNISHFVGSEDDLRPMNIWDCTIALVLQIKNWLPQEKMRVVADAYFSKATFINALLQEGIHLISRLRKDAVAWDDAPAYQGRGRPRKRGRKWQLAELLNASTTCCISVRIYGKVQQLSVIVRNVWLRGVKVRVVVIRSQREPIILLSTDLGLSATQIIQMYAARFTMEIGIRDLKQYFGLDDYQCYKSQAILRFVHLSCLAFCICRLILLEGGPLFSEKDDSVGIVESEFSFRKIRRHLRRFVLKQIIFAKSPEDADLQKIEAEYEQLFRMAA